MKNQKYISIEIYKMFLTTHMLIRYKRQLWFFRRTIFTKASPPEDKTFVFLTIILPSIYLLRKYYLKEKKYFPKK